MKTFASIILLVSIVGLGGCASQPSKFYTLSPTGEPAQMTESFSIAVGPVYLPPVVDRPHIVLTTSAHEVKIDEFHRWASPLQSEIAQVVAENLARTLGTGMVSVFPQGAATGASYRVMIDIMRFETTPGKGVNLDSVWTVRAAKEKSSRTGRTMVSEAISDTGTAGLVAAHSRALGRLSGDVAAAIRGLGIEFLR